MLFRFFSNRLVRFRMRTVLRAALLLVIISLVTGLVSWPSSRVTGASGTVSGVAHYERAPLESLLNPDGTINRTAGITGSFDASGYRMALTATGAPRFVPLAPPSCGAGDWDLNFTPLDGTGAVNALAVMGNAIYVGGTFSFIGFAGGANEVAKFDTTTNTWSLLQQGDGNGVNGEVHALAVMGTNLYVGGFFTTANLHGTGATPEIPANAVAKFDTITNTWSALKQGDGNGVSGAALALAVMGANLYVTNFTGGGPTVANLGGTGATPEIPVNCVSKFDTTSDTWSALKQGDGYGLNGPVGALAMIGANLYVGGGFTTANSGGTGATPEIPANGVAKFDTTTNTWSALKQGDGNGLGDPVGALAVIGTNLYVGGTFTTANFGGTGATPEIPANAVAKFDTITNTWSALKQGDGNGVADRVSALAVNGTTLYVGGGFTTANFGGTGATPAITANHVARFETSTNTWSAIVDSETGNGVNGPVSALAVKDCTLYVGGQFTRAGVAFSSRVGRYVAKASDCPSAIGGSDVTVTFACASQAGSTTLTPIPPGSAGSVPGGFTLCLTCPAYDITTTKLYSPPVTVCLAVPAGLTQPEFSVMKLMHGEGGTLVDRTTSHFTDGSSQRWVCGSVNTLSPFALAQGQTPTATNAAISGRIIAVSGAPVAGAEINLSGPESRETIADANGAFRFDQAQTNGFYTVTPSRPNFIFTPANRSFSLLGLSADASFMAVPEAAPIRNLLDTNGFFVRQQYLDFLGREPDQAGFDFWNSLIAACGIDQQCIEKKRIDVSAAFFLSIELKQTRYLVERLYKTAYGDAIGASVIGGTHQLQAPIVRFSEFLPDTQQISQEVIVGQSGWETVLENNKQSFISRFVERSRFTVALPVTLTPAQFVDQLNQNAGQVLSATERATAIGLFGGTIDTSNTLVRAQVLRQVAEDQDLQNSEFNRAFVLMEYFGYLQRDPNSDQDSDYTGYDFWLTKLNQFNGSYLDAEMVKAFITSPEYRQRFGP